MTEAVTGDVDGIEPKPPMAERFRFNARDFPYWLVAILGILAWMLVLIVTNDQYREAWDAIIPGLTTTISATLYGFALALVIGLLAGLGRISRNVVAAQRRDHLHRVHPRRADPRAAVHDRVRRSCRSSRARSASATRACRIFPRACSRSPSSTARTWPRCSAPASSRCRRARPRPVGRSA